MKVILITCILLIVGCSSESNLQKGREGSVSYRDTGKNGLIIILLDDFNDNVVVNEGALSVNGKTFKRPMTNKAHVITLRLMKQVTITLPKNFVRDLCFNEADNLARVISGKLNSPSLSRILKEHYAKAIE